MLRLREPRPPTSGASGFDPSGQPEAEDALDSARRIRCRGCGAPVSASEQIFSPSLSSARCVFANPAGRVFEVLCVRRAVSVRAWGEPTLEHTWFAGYGWRAITCAKCGRHLGWRFDAVAGADPGEFFGLITSEVVEDER